MAEINQIAATTGNDPALDTLLLRLHTETACRRGGALALRPADLDSEQCLIRLREKGETMRWQPVSPTLMAHLPRLTGRLPAPQAAMPIVWPMLSGSSSARSMQAATSARETIRPRRTLRP
jgi:integrase/recombinase XerC